jgi:iron complex transport system substrate-binding protein
MVGCGGGPPPEGVTDDLGREINISSTPTRIISHVPSITEILFALGLDEEIIGVSTFCDYPEAAKAKEKVGDFWSPSMEKIVALEPDLVFTTGDNQPLMAELDTLGITCIALQPKDIDGVMRDIELIGSVTGTRTRAASLVSDMRERVSAVLATVAGAPRPRVFYVVDASNLNAPWTAGPGSFIDSLITMVGGENVGALAKVQWAEFSIEQVVSSDPEIVVIPAKDGVPFTRPQDLAVHAIWGQVTAVKQGQVVTIDDDLVSLYGPRVVQGLEEMARIIHPELFP